MSADARGGLVARRLALAAVVLAALAASGCTEPDPVEASTWNMPDIVWDGGAAPSGGAEDSPWAKEFRAEQLKTTYVWATVDTSYPEYVKQVGYDEAVRLGESFDRSVGNLKDFDSKTGEYVPDAPVRWAAQRLLVTNVVEDPSGDSAVIEYSYVAYTVNFSEHVDSSAVRLTHRGDEAIAIEEASPSDAVAGTDSASGTDAIAVEDIPTARWATPITAPTLAGEVKMPLAREYYVKLGVISE